MTKQYDVAYIIGRMQPVHNGHMHLIRQASKIADEVLILIGSSFQARSPENPFTFEERQAIIGQACSDEGLNNVFFRPIMDYPDNDALWTEQTQKVMFEFGDGKKTKPCVVGFNKDKSTYYLKKFPDIPSVTITPDEGLINATDIRNAYFDRLAHFPSDMLVPKSTLTFLGNFYKTEAYQWLKGEDNFYKHYDPKAFPVQINCVDNVVIQSAHVLLVERANHPGMGLLALPGGHVEGDEYFIDAAVRELIEETNIMDGQGEKSGKHIPPAVLKSYIMDHEWIDTPGRSLRGRVNTMAYLYKLPDRSPLYKVKGMDDAKHARWYKLGELKPELFFEDHYHIIQKMTRRIKSSD
jgi:bifunctional NMN adenylyltransferase/nudix hydrolase